MQDMVFKIKTIEEARSLANKLSTYCPEPSKAMLGLQELLINSIEHGNLGIDYAEKTKLQKINKWLETIKKRLKLPSNKDKYVEVNFSKDNKKITIVIRDNGKGFDHKKYLNFKESDILEPHGRGILLARSLSFDKVTYNNRGNSVTCLINL